MQAPVIVMSWINQNSGFYKFMTTTMSLQQPVGLIVYALLIIAFTFFYTHLQVDPEKISEDFGKNGSYIPCVRP